MRQPTSLFGVATALALLAACGGGSVARDEVADPCAAPVRAPELPPAPSPDRLGSGPPSPEIRVTDTEPALLRQWGAPEQLGQSPAVGVDVGEGLVFYRADGRSPDGETLDEFYASDGLLLDASAIEDAITPDELSAMFPDRVVDAEVGPYPGVVNQSDPDVLGNRTIVVTWTSEELGYTLRTNADVETALALAREVSCQ